MNRRRKAIPCAVVPSVWYKANIDDGNLLEQSMNTRSLKLYDTTLGKKAVMAVSGLALIGFVFGHMAGNLLIFKGPDDERLCESTARMAGGAGIWIARFG